MDGSDLSQEATANGFPVGPCRPAQPNGDDTRRFGEPRSNPHCLLGRNQRTNHRHGIARPMPIGRRLHDRDVAETKNSPGTTRQLTSSPGTVEQRHRRRRPQDCQRDTGQANSGAHIEQGGRRMAPRPASGERQAVGQVARPDSIRLLRTQAAGRNRFLDQPIAVLRQRRQLRRLQRESNPGGDAGCDLFHVKRRKEPDVWLNPRSARADLSHQIHPHQWKPRRRGWGRLRRVRRATRWVPRPLPLSWP